MPRLGHGSQPIVLSGTSENRGRIRSGFRVLLVTFMLVPMD